MSYDKAISYSGMKLYKKCPLLWKDNYILGNREPSGPAAERGTILHAKLEDFFNGKGPYPSGDKVLRPWQAYMEGLASKGLRAEGEVAVTKDWAPIAYDDPAAHFRGKMDGDIEELEVLDIYDWKSGKIYPEHVDQGRAYTALSTTNKPLIRAHFVYLDIPTYIESWEYTQNQVTQFRATIDRQIQVIRLDEEYKPTPGDECRWCKKSWRKHGDCTAAP